MKAASMMKLAAVAALGLVALAAAPAWAQLSTTANGPYYATPSWDQKLTANRFVILANWNSEAVLDRETGLVWERSPEETTRDWYAAQSRCINRSVAGRKGWRMPSAQDLASLVDPTVAIPGPTLPAGHPFLNVQSSFYWSATTLAFNAAYAWGVYFNNAILLNEGKDNGHYVWCVRGGQGPDAQ